MVSAVCREMRTSFRLFVSLSLLPPGEGRVFSRDLRESSQSPPGGSRFRTFSLIPLWHSVGCLQRPQLSEGPRSGFLGVAAVSFRGIQKTFPGGDRKGLLGSRSKVPGQLLQWKPYQVCANGFSGQYAAASVAASNHWQEGWIPAGGRRLPTGVLKLS